MTDYIDLDDAYDALRDKHREAVAKLEEATDLAVKLGDELIAARTEIKVLTHERNTWKATADDRKARLEGVAKSIEGWPSLRTDDPRRVDAFMIEHLRRTTKVEDPGQPIVAEVPALPLLCPHGQPWVEVRSATYSGTFGLGCVDCARGMSGGHVEVSPEITKKAFELAAEHYGKDANDPMPWTTELPIDELASLLVSFYRMGAKQ